MAKKQLRRCANCQKAGHNKSTCAALPADQTAPQKTTRQPLKFFVHHVAHGLAASPHVINLKKERDSLWKQIEAVSPEPDAALYQRYHEISLPPRPRAEFIRSSPPPAAAERAPGWLAGLLPGLWQKINQAQHICLRSLAAFFHRLFPTKGLAAAGGVIIFLIIIPGPARSYYHRLESIKNTAANNGLAGFAALQDSAAALREANLDKANAATRQALVTFDKALSAVSRHGVLDTLARALPVVGSEVASRENILLAGQEIAVGNSYLLRGLSAAAESASSTLLQQTDFLLGYIGGAIPNYQKAFQHLNAVKTSGLPLEYQSQFVGYKKIFESLVSDLENLTDLGGAIREIFGGRGLRRYLLVFQNESELRPTGGFMGSFAVVDVKDGEILNLEIPPGGTYAVQGQLREYVKPPAPLLLSNKRWEFQDANWFPDFPTSAQKMMWFYAHSRGVSVDGVIAINSSVLQRILAVTGPMTDKKRQLTLTADNALPVIQQIVEEGPEKKINQPKQILTELAPQFLGALRQVTGTKILSLLYNVSEALKQKEIQAYFTDNQTERAVRSFGWAGALLDSTVNKDYLLVVNTNIQGQKSDAKIRQTISHQAVVAPDGSITDDVVITREHLGNRGEKLYGQTNIDFLRLYAPKGSILLSAGGFSWPEEKKFQVPDAWSADDPFLAARQIETGVDQNSGTIITEESGKTVFGNWVITEPGEISQVQFTYRLPFTVFSPAPEVALAGWKKMLGPEAKLARYQLVIQKQSGITADFESRIIFPENWRPEWSDGQAMKLAKNGAIIGKSPLIADSVWSLLMKKHSL